MTRTPQQVVDGEPAHIALNLPRPPSANHLKIPLGLRTAKGGKRRATMINSTEYKAWRTAAGWTANVQSAGQCIPGLYALRIHLPPGLDLDNCLKPTNDLLQKVAKVIRNDGLCELLIVLRDRTLARDRIGIELWSVAA